MAGTFSNLYNCHAFALHFKGRTPSDAEAIWIDNPEIYFTDGSLIEVDINQVKVGDIIAYYNFNEQNELLLDHTGVVTSITNRTLTGIGIRSKDGEGLIFDHNPRASNYYSEDNNIKFYTWNHTYNGTCNSNGDSNHYYSCRKCTNRKYEPHIITYTQLESAFVHLATCTSCSYSENREHNYTQVGSKYRCIECRYMSSFQAVTPTTRSVYEILFICSYDETQNLMTYDEMIEYLLTNNYHELLIEFIEFYNHIEN